MPTGYDSISLKNGIWKDPTCPNGAEITNIVVDGVTVWHKDYVGLTYTKLEDSSYSIRAEDTSISGDIKIHAVYYFNSGLATSIENRGFYNCNNITSVDIYDGIQSIGNEAFASCDNLIYVILPTSVTYIGVDALNGVSRIYYKGSYDDWNNFIVGLDDYTKDILGARTYVYAGSNASHPLPGGGTDADTLPAPDGFKGYWYYDDDGVPATLCNYYADDGLLNFSVEETLKPTCDERGYNTWTCNDCGKKWYEYIEPLGHDYSEYVVAPTCTERGYTLHMCWNCMESYEDNYTDALGHSYGEWTITLEPTCTTAGSKTRTCTRTCRGVKCTASETETIAATGHDWVAATCITPKTCRTCGETQGEALGHIEVIDHAVLPTCTEKGLSEGKHCSRCGTILVPQTTMQPLGHTWADATCTKPKTCSVCGATEGSTLEHPYGEWTITLDPTCTTAGSKTRTCTVCNHAITNSISALGHKYSSVVTAPTCTAQGYTTHTCSTCGDSYVDTYTAATGHDWSPWNIVSKPTCTMKGSNKRTCSVCDAFETQMVAAKGHTWQAATCTKPKTCSVCGATEGSALGHTSVSYPYVVPTYTTVGYRGGSYCSVCGTVIEARDTILKTPEIRDAILSQGTPSIDLWVQNNNSLPVTCYVSIYDDDATNLNTAHFTIAANTTGYINIAITSSAIYPLECYVYFEASGYENSYEETYIIN